MAAAPEGEQRRCDGGHLARWFDLLAHRIFRGLDASEELWHRDGWRERTRYDPRGIGSRGWGVVSGYTTEEVARIPALTSEEPARRAG